MRLQKTRSRRGKVWLLVAVVGCYSWGPSPRRHRMLIGRVPKGKCAAVVRANQAVRVQSACSRADSRAPQPAIAQRTCNLRPCLRVLFSLGDAAEIRSRSAGIVRSKLHGRPNEFPRDAPCSSRPRLTMAPRQRRPTNACFHPWSPTQHHLPSSTITSG